MAGVLVLFLAACGGGGGGGGGNNPPFPANNPPTANAGTNQTVSSGTVVTLNGAASSDSDGTVANYAWTQTAGSAVTLSSTTAAQPTFTAPTVSTATTLTFSLIVRDNANASSAASTVNVTVNPPPNTPPTANAGSPQTVSGGALVTLNGSASSDPDGSIASYAWTQTAGTAVTLSSTTGSQPTFTAPVVSAAATLTFSLTVTDNAGATSTASTVNVTVNPAGNVSGRVRFTRIPVTATGLNYAAPVLQPARGVLVRAVDAGSSATLATSSTDPNGDFSLAVAANTSIRIVVVSQMLRDNSQPLPRWNFRSLDADATSPAPYTYTDGVSFNSNAGTGRNVDIPSGFDATGNVTGTRASAPFAILDSVYQAMQLVLGVASTTNFPEMVIDWAPNNPGGGTFFSTDGNGNPASPINGQVMVLSADVTEDTDEFDQHVIAHEFGHYIEYNFSRADNIGGPHGLGDKLDIRVAFGEGFGYAFGAIVLNDPVVRDTYRSPTQFQGCVANNGSYLCSSTFNVETNPPVSGGTPAGNFGCWCSESSVWSILWDLHDNTLDGADTLNLGFQPMWNVLVNQQRITPAFTSIFSFISALKAANPAQAAAIDTLLAAQNIDPVADAFGTGETHVPTPVASSAALPLYTAITVGGPAVVLRNVDDAGHYNTLGNHRYLRFTLAAQRASLTITVSSSNTANPDPDFFVYRDGAFAALGLDPPPQPEVETISPAPAGNYLIDVYDCANGCADEEGTPGDYDITVTVN